LQYWALVAGRRSIALALPIAVAALVVGVQAGAGRPAVAPPVARASEYAIQIEIPGQIPVLVGQHAAPPWASTSDGSFTYPADGSVVQIATVTGRTLVTVGGATARAGADMTKLSLFGGEITADAVVARAAAVLHGASGSADFGGSAITNLSVLGQPVTPAANLRIALADWGHVFLLEETDNSGTTHRVATAHALLTTIDVWLDAPHAGLPGAPGSSSAPPMRS